MQTMQEKHKNAEILASRRAKRNAAQQLLMLDERLGFGVGARKERARLMLQIQTKGQDNG